MRYGKIGKKTGEEERKREREGGGEGKRGKEGGG